MEEQKTNKKKTWKYILLITAGLFILIQLYPLERSNPPVTHTPDWDSEQTRETFKKACANCHSHETDWPWYAYVAPVSWLVVDDVHSARGHFNISIPDPGHSDEAAEEVREGEMPLPIYTLMHSEADLTEKERKEFAEGLEKTFGKESEESEEQSSSSETDEDDEHKDHEH